MAKYSVRYTVRVFYQAVLALKVKIMNQEKIN
jgi:hypothetical protein